MRSQSSLQASQSPGWRISLAAVAAMGLSCTQALAKDPPGKVDYNRDIRPILSDTCYACHGPDQKARKAELRLDRKEDVFKDRDGYAVVVPGDLESSAIIERIESDDPVQKMPPRKSGKTLTAEQIAKIEAWVAAGAPWKEHWSFVPPQRPDEPEVRGRKWVRNPIDAFILDRLEDEGLSPSPEASKETLIRRVTLDLTGLPPTPQEVDAFLADKSRKAYEKVVDRLLASPRYGEHMARFWLDAARYGDTHGLHLDNYREIWPYRDWVISAFNRNLRFDEFVIEQIAGDLLPNASLDQIVATGFERCNVTTNEGGSIEEEVYVRNVVDRVETTGTVFLGLTIGCARCHDHKFDPIRQKDFYSLFAFFNSIDGSEMDGNSAKHAPIVQVPSDEQKQKLDDLKQQLAALHQKIAAAVADVKYDDSLDKTRGEYVARADYVWIDEALPPAAQPSQTGGHDLAWNFVTKPDDPVYSGEKAVKLTADGLKQHHFTGAKPALKLGEGDVLFAYVFIDPVNPPKEIMLQWHTDTWKYRAYWGQNLIEFGKDGTPERLSMGALPTTGKWVRLEVPISKLRIKPGTMITGWAFSQNGGTVYWDHAGLETWTPQEGQTYDSLSSWVAAQKALSKPALPKEILDIVKLDRRERKDDQKKKLLAYFLETAYAGTREQFAPLFAERDKLEKARTDLEGQIATTLVFKERKEPKPAFLLDRGEYDRKKDQVGRDTPGFLPALPADAPRDRLGLARWMVASENPLVARVAVNRFWQQCFGTGLVKTAEDFGFQGEPPSHPELLDWLAVQFREDGWDIRAFMKRLVMSATYRQSSRVTPDRLAKDPANRLLSRGPRYRLDAESLRDQALAVSDLLVERVGGPSVKPPQPAGLWEAVGYTSSNTAKFVPDHGVEKVHRRSMYTFWKRTSAPPQMTTFDAPSREACIMRRERTNTPLQALLLMNETQFVEAARALAGRAIREGGSSLEDRISYLFRLATARRPAADELAELVAVHNEHLRLYTSNIEAAKKLIAIGETRPNPALDPSELAAMTMTANLVLNLDEVLNKE